MVLGGLWHGASWTFILWGFYHACLLIAHRLFLSVNIFNFKDIRPNYLVRGLNVLLFFHLSCIGWLFFRAQSLDQALAMSKTFFTSFALPGWDLLINVISYLYLLFIMDFIEHRHGDLFAFFKIKKGYQLLIYFIIFVSLLLSTVKIQDTTQREERKGPKQFIYFQF